VDERPTRGATTGQSLQPGARCERRHHVGHGEQLHAEHCEPAGPRWVEAGAQRRAVGQLGEEATLKAAALKAVPGGTVIRIETDAGDNAYEAHTTKADGSLVTVKFDANLTVIKVEDGMGRGDPAPAGKDHDGTPGN